MWRDKSGTFAVYGWWCTDCGLGTEDGYDDISEYVETEQEARVQYQEHLLSAWHIEVGLAE